MVAALTVAGIVGNRLHIGVVWEQTSTNYGSIANRELSAGIKSRLQQCQEDEFGYAPVLNKIQVASDLSQKGPKILCFVNTHEKNHDTRVQAVLETWGPKCDKLVFASSKTDESIGAIKIPNTTYVYADLWNKHRETLRYIYTAYKDDDYDWFFKADDDTYVIVENLRQYLGSSEIQEQHKRGVPLHIGNPVQMHVDENGVQDGSRTIHDKNIASSFLERVNHNFIFNVGGAGYAMNHAFMEKMAEWIDRPECALSKNESTLLDDSTLSICSSNFGVVPYRNTRDAAGRERFHQETPHVLNTLSPEDWRYDYFSFCKQKTGGFQLGDDCCSTESITFHHLDPKEMRFTHDMLYLCREEEKNVITSTSFAASTIPVRHNAMDQTSYSALLANTKTLTMAKSCPL